MPGLLALGTSKGVHQLCEAAAKVPADEGSSGVPVKLPLLQTAESQERER